MGRLTAAGLPKVVQLSDDLPVSYHLGVIQAAGPIRLGSDYLVEVMGKDFGDVLPQEYSSHPVWYIKLAPEHRDEIEDFLELIRK